MRRLLIQAVAIVALSTPPAAVAEPGRSDSQEEILVRRILTRYARCLIKSDPRGVQSALLADPNSGQFERWRRQLRGECMTVPREGYHVYPEDAQLRFVLADDLIRQTKAKIVPGDLAALPPLLHPSASAPLGGKVKNVPVDPFLAYLSPLGECVVRAQPAKAAALLQTKPSTAVESASTDVLLGEVSSCTGGRSLVIDTATFRGAVALAYYRLAKAAGKAK